MDFYEKIRTLPTQPGVYPVSYTHLDRYVSANWPMRAALSRGLCTRMRSL